IGHSERREYFKETDAVLAKKTLLVLSRGLKPIFCIGEVLSEREAGKHFDVVSTQLSNGLFQLDETQFRNVVLAYEPVWAIGTGVTASPAQAQEMHAFIREQVASRYSKALADETTILYGGSCKPDNAQELFANPDVDGGLIGGASLKADDFIQIVNAF
ncbi:MAG: triose-phosphate isomerase, partial [Bacteroidales bacterium]|nr:triose-phosphate isomerase [Bacteroidales bacterium]